VKQGLKEGWYGNAKAINADVSNKVRLVAGNSSDFRGGILGKWTRAQIKKIVLGIVKTISLSDSQQTRVFTAMEVEQAKKFGPKSTYSGWIKMKDMEKVEAINSDKPLSPAVSTQLLDKAFDLLTKYIPEQSLTPLTFDEVMKGGLGTGPVTIESMGLDTNKSSGFPYLAKAYKPNDDQTPEDRRQSELAFQWIKKRFNYLWPKVRSSDFVPRFRCNVHFRVVSVGEKWKDVKKKTRLVIAPSKDETVLGKTYTGPIQQKLKTVTFLGGKSIKMGFEDLNPAPYCAWHDLTYIDIIQQRLLKIAKDNNLVIESGDVSGFDASLLPTLIERCGVVDAKWVKAGKAPINLAKSMVAGFDFMTPEGIVKGTRGSMKSGSVHTNKYDTMALTAILFYGHLNGDFELLAYEVNGDDFCAVGEGLDPNSISRLFNSFNLEVHPDKQFYEPGMLSYLQRIHRYGYLGGSSSVARVINSATSYERLKVKSKEWNPYVEVVRVLAQLENAAFSPYFERIVKFVQSGDKYKLGADFKDPMEIIRRAGATGAKVMSEDVVGAWHSNGDPESFSNWAVNGVLRGESLPLLGSKQRFERVYGERVEPYRKDLDSLSWIVS
jgi:hypothetical protein